MEGVKFPSKRLEMLGKNKETTSTGGSVDTKKFSNKEEITTYNYHYYNSFFNKNKTKNNRIYHRSLN